MSMECPKCSTRAWSARCPECGFQLLPDGPSAGSSFELEVRPLPLSAARPTTALSGLAPRAQVARPPGSSVAPLMLARPWDRKLAFGWLLVFALCELVALRTAHQFALPVRLLFAVVGIAPLYAAFCFALNKTTLFVGSGWLEIVRVPLPAGGNKRIPLHDITQIFVRTTFHTRRKHRWMRYGSSHEDYFRYHVMAELLGVDELKLLGDFADVDEARSIERRLEHHLGITDDPTRSLSERRA